MRPDEKHTSSTVGRHTLQGWRALLSALRNAFPEDRGVKQLALSADVSYSRARHLVREMERRGDIERIAYGRYRAKTPSAEVEVRFENVVLVAKTPHKVAPRGAGYMTLTQTRIDDLKRRAKGAPPGFEHLIEKTFYGVRPVFLQWFDNGTVTVQCGSGRLPPMSVADLIGFWGWVQGRFPDIPTEGPEGWKLKSIELNHDFPELRMEGLKSGSFRDALDRIVKFYVKKTGLRIEVRQLLNLDLSEAIVQTKAVFDSFAKKGLIDTGTVPRDDADEGELGRG